MIFRPVKTLSDGIRHPEDEAWDLLFAAATARLEARITQYEPPALASLPCQDLVVVYRFPRDQRTHFVKSEALDLIIPGKYRKESTPFSLGLLMWAGAEAMDVLVDHGILLGDIVKFAPLAGDEEMANAVNEAMEAVAERGGSEGEAVAAAKLARDAQMEQKKHLRLRVSDIHESVDLMERLGGPRPLMEMVRRREGGRHIHVIRPVINNVKEMLNADR